MSQKHVSDDPSRDSVRDDPQFAQLAAELSELPVSLEPERDLWPEVASRLGPRRQAVVRFPRWHLVSSHPAWRHALAAGLGLVAGALFTYLALGGSGATSPSFQGDVRLTSSMGQPSQVGLDQAEMQFLRAKEELWIAVFARRGKLSPEAWEMVEQNLQILDNAATDLREALGEDPGNPELERSILNNQRRSLDLLRGVASGLSNSV